MRRLVVLAALCLGLAACAAGARQTVYHNTQLPNGHQTGYEAPAVGY
ncbi:MAG TPA: hypothetical protein VFA50_20300 [Stellaceae bacterium]|nr:hypothetical protein [Stellaceae bacterium]